MLISGLSRGRMLSHTIIIATAATTSFGCHTCGGWFNSHCRVGLYRVNNNILPPIVAAFRPGQSGVSNLLSAEEELLWWWQSSASPSEYFNLFPLSSHNQISYLRPRVRTGRCTVGNAKTLCKVYQWQLLRYLSRILSTWTFLFPRDDEWIVRKRVL